MNDCFYVKVVRQDPLGGSDQFKIGDIFLAQIYKPTRHNSDRYFYYQIWDKGEWSGGWDKCRFEKLPEDQQEICRLVYG